MIQILFLALAAFMVICACVAMSGKMQLTRNKPLTGGSAVAAFMGLIAGAAGVAFFALVILPTI